MTQYYGLRDWEWMLRTAAPEEDFSDIWEGARPRRDEEGRLVSPGTNPEAEEWLNNRVQYHRPDVAFPEHLRPTDWIGRAQEDIPSERNVQGEHEETNRSIDDSHSAFQSALINGLGRDLPYDSPYDPTDPEPQPYEPTSPERLASDEAWALGPGKHFDFPGGHDQAAAMHNGMHQRGFDLENEGTDEHPSPAYVHRDTYAAIRPGVDETGQPGWALSVPGSDTTHHSGQASAAALHQKKMDDINAAEAARHQAEELRRARQHSYTPYDSSGPDSRSDATPSGRRREAPDYIPKSKAQGMSWQSLFHNAIHGNNGYGREFERASVKSVLNPEARNTGRLYGVHSDQWNDDFEKDRQGQGKVSQAIYHYETPIAWKFHRVQPDGTYNEGTWRRPATSFGSGGFFSTRRVQGLMGGAFHGTNHISLRDPLVNHKIHRALEAAGVRRQDDQTYHTYDSFGNDHRIAPSQSGSTAVHTVTSPTGSAIWKKRVPIMDAVHNTMNMIHPHGAGQPLTSPGAYLRSKNYTLSGDDAPTPRRRRDVPLRLQPEIPGVNRTSSADWARFLRDD